MNTANYATDGYVVIDTGLKEEIAALRQTFTDIFSWSATLNGLPPIKNDADIIKLYTSGSNNRKCWVGAYDQIRLLPEFFALTSNRVFLDAAKAIGIKRPCFSMRPLIRVDMPEDSERRFQWHQDYPYNKGSLNAITVWIPFQDVDEQIGPLNIQPGSHQAQQIMPHHEGILLESKFERLKQMPVKQGEAIVFSQFLVHEGGYNRSNRIRFTTQLRINDLSEVAFAQRHYPLNFAERVNV